MTIDSSYFLPGGAAGQAARLMRTAQVETGGQVATQVDAGVEAPCVLAEAVKEGALICTRGILDGLSEAADKREVML